VGYGLEACVVRVVKTAVDRSIAAACCAGDGTVMAIGRENKTSNSLLKQIFYLLIFTRAI
jgi:arginine repressor